MCGLTAIYAYDGDAPPISESALAACNAHMARRGPDGDGLWVSDDRRIGLAHRRLAIIDLNDRAAQPMSLRSGGSRIDITYNGEIYNFLELRRELEDSGAVFETESDTEVLLHLYRRHGADMVGRLRGMFAFAIWDAERQGMLLGRDAFGIKPLYYMDDGKTVFAASQVKALLAGLKASGQPTPSENAAGHAGFFLFGHVPDPMSLYDGIRALPAGTTLWIDGGGARREKTWFDVSGRMAEADSTSVDAIDLGALLRDSIAHHLIADVPVGVFLSAGLDSATLVGLASEIKGTSLDTLTLGFDEFSGSPNDEVPLAETVADCYGTRQHTVRVAGSNFRDDLDDLLDVMDQPSIDGVNTYYVAKAAARAGLKVAISGLGGDELFRGYDGFTQIPALTSRLSRVPGGAGLGRVLRRLAAPLSHLGLSPKAAGLLEYGTRIGDAYLLRRALYMPWELAGGIPGVLDSDLARQGLQDLDVLARLNDCQAPVSGAAGKVAALEMNFYMRGQLLRDADWAGMAHSLEIRVPLVDADLFTGLAGALALGQGPDKAAMAATPKTPLPDAVLNRSKTGFFVPVREWMSGSSNGDRGLRGWAKTVYQAQTR
ncbi:MAG: asparagine synthase (glutamine-hydrolyzing) [Alphaproteobacteria bacterium]